MSQYESGRRSSRCGADSGVRGELRWRKSTASGAVGNCVEAAYASPSVVQVRDSKNPAGPRVAVSAGALGHLVTFVSAS